MRFLFLPFLMIVLFFSTHAVYALDGIPKTLTAGGQKLVLNGAGTRTKFVISVYHAGLYLKKKSNDAKKIIVENEPMAIRMKIVSGFASAEKIKAALLKGFNNSTGGNTKPIQAEINQLLGAAFKGKISKGDVFDLAYANGNTQVLKNGKTMTVVKGLPIKRALFGIWLSSRPAQSSLKDELLGKEF